VTLPTLHLVGDIAQSSLDAVAELQARAAELEAQVAALEQARADDQTALRHMATLASSATLACNGRDQFAQAQLRALSFLATAALETP
jgi:hypothetical protein